MNASSSKNWTRPELFIIEVFSMSYGADVGIVTTHPKELNALFSVFGMNSETNRVSRNGTNYWLEYARLGQRGTPIRIVIGILNAPAGNTESAITATLLIRNWAPRLICVCGFAAGKKGRVTIGDVVIAERVHDNTIKALEGGIFQARSESRSRSREINEMFKLRPPDIDRIRSASGIAAMPAIDTILKRAEAVGLTERDVSAEIILHDGSVVSDNTLLRDASFFEKFTIFTDEKCRAGEMEAAGVTRAAELLGVPWVVVRGISDFGDSGKNDEFHQLASVRAAIVLRDILTSVIDVPSLQKIPASEEWTSPNGSLEIEVEQAFRHKRWDAVVELGRLLSRPLWLASRYQERVRIGKYVEEAAARLNRHRERAAALVDDIG